MFRGVFGRIGNKWLCWLWESRSRGLDNLTMACLQRRPMRPETSPSYIGFGSVMIIRSDIIPSSSPLYGQGDLFLNDSAHRSSSSLFPTTEMHLKSLLSMFGKETTIFGSAHVEGLAGVCRKSKLPPHEVGFL